MIAWRREVMTIDDDRVPRTTASRQAPGEVAGSTEASQHGDKAYCDHGDVHR